jgi:hypothetical protein
MQVYRPIAVATIIILALPLLSGCTTAATGEFMADNMPTWMGGEPEGIPPRPSDPRYPEYERAQQAKAAAVKTDPAKPEAAK